MSAAVALLVSVALVGAVAQGGDTVLSVRRNVGDTIETRDFVVEMSSGFVPWVVSRSRAPPDGEILLLANPEDACSPIAIPEKVQQGGNRFVVVARRGKCSYEQKVRGAAAAGAYAIVIYDTVEAIYPANRTTGLAINAEDGGPCRAVCEWGQGWVRNYTRSEALEGFQGSPCSSLCPSGLCALTGRVENAQSEICCLPDELMEMGTTTPPPVKATIALFASTGDGLALRAFISASNSARVDIYKVPAKFPVSSFILWIFGSVVAATCALLAAHLHRRREVVPPEGPDGPNLYVDSPDQQLDLTPLHVGMYLALATATLIGLFFLIHAGERYVVLTLIVVYCVCAAGTTFTLVTRPLLILFSRRHCRGLLKKQLIIRVPVVISVPALDAVAFALSCSAALTWGIFRNTSGAWIVQDFFGLIFVVSFFGAVRLRTIKVAVILLVLFMVYDIFMVFISPMIFKKSIMLAVATAGAGSSEALSNGVCVRTPDERMPMLFVIPRTGGNGYAMLGLGDILLPGLLLVFAARYDLHQFYRSATGDLPPQRRSTVKYRYFYPLAVAYAVGLLFAFTANWLGITINGVQGQPALLYLVPATLIPFLFLAYRRGEYGVLWNGPFEAAAHSIGGTCVLSDPEEGGDHGEMSLLSQRKSNDTP